MHAMALLLSIGCTDPMPVVGITPKTGAVDTGDTGDTGTIQPSLLSLEHAAFEAMVLGRSITMSLDVAASVTLHCTDAALPEEVHTARSDAASSHTISIFGLLAEHDYDCEVWAGGALVGDFAFQTDALPENAPALSTTGTPGWGAYTLFNHFTGATDPLQKLLLVDPEGRIRWYWLLDMDVQEGIEAIFIGEDRVLLAGGMGFPPTIVSLTGEIEYRGPDASSGGAFHHDVALLETGDILGLAEAENTLDGEVWKGFLIELRSAYTGELTGEWNSQTAVDAGQLAPASGVAVDPYHANAATHTIDDDGEAFLLSLSGTDQLARLDAKTGLLSWKLGTGGDFVLLDEDGKPLTGGWFEGQHGPHWDLPLVMIYDNQGLGRQSRALQLRLDTEAMTAQIVWQWTEEGWYETVWGGTDVLEGGNVLIARGHCSFCGSAKESLSTEVIEVDPATDEAVWRLIFPTREDGLYRAERLEGCAIFGNEAYCSQ